MTDFPDDDMLAGEYALGTLAPDERADASLRRATDPRFDALVNAWEQRLAPLSEQTREVEPPAHLWSAILARIAGAVQERAPEGATILRLHRQVRVWRLTSGISAALAACLVGWVAVSSMRPVPAGQTFVAVLQKTDEAPGFIVRASLGDRTLSVRPLAVTPPEGKSYELWAIDSSLPAPKSLGVIGTDASRKLVPDIPAATLERATYAVTVEQAGGSPTGKPTSAPIFFGHLLRIDP